MIFDHYKDARKAAWKWRATVFVVLLDDGTTAFTVARNRYHAAQALGIPLTCVRLPMEKELEL
jgi:hypothetical protein